MQLVLSAFNFMQINRVSCQRVLRGGGGAMETTNLPTNLSSATLKVRSYFVASAHDRKVVGSKLVSFKYYMEMVSKPCQAGLLVVRLLNIMSILCLKLSRKQK